MKTDFWEHSAEGTFTMWALVIFVIMNVCSFFWVKNTLTDIQYRQRVENLGTFLITKVCEREKGCSKINMQLGDVSIGKIYKNNFIIGDMIFIPDYGKFVVRSFGIHNSIDIYTPNLQEAKKHGAKRKRVYLITE